VISERKTRPKRKKCEGFKSEDRKKGEGQTKQPSDRWRKGQRSKRKGKKSTTILKAWRGILLDNR